MAPSSTSLFVEWGAIPPQFENGIIRGFKIQFHEIPFNGTVEEREGQPLLRWMILDNLKKFTFYSIQVRAFTTEGYGPENKLKARTGQDGMFLSYDVIDCKNWESYKILDGRLFSYYVYYMG